MVRFLSAAFALVAGCHLVGGYHGLEAGEACIDSSDCSTGRTLCLAQRCEQGVCVAVPEPEGTRCLANSCDGRGQCVGYTACSQPHHCPTDQPLCDRGACVACVQDLQCESGEVCEVGACRCDSGDVCGGVCTDTTTDPDHCGGCDRRCLGSCDEGACAWRPLSTTDQPMGRHDHVALVSDLTQSMLVWGGRTAFGFALAGARYQFGADAWTPVPQAGAPRPRADMAAAVLDPYGVIWGGRDESGELGDGGFYDFFVGSWIPIQPGPLSARVNHSMVAAPGVGMIVWGGWDGDALLADGMILRVPALSWDTIPDAPYARQRHTATFVPEAGGSGRMVVLGGMAASGDEPMGMALDLDTMTWSTLDATSAPALRFDHTATYHPPTNSVVIVGGFTSPGVLADRAFSWPGDDVVWTPLADYRVYGHSAALILDDIVVLGGIVNGSASSAAFSLDVSGGGTVPIPLGPIERSGHTAVSDGFSMYVWGGEFAGVDLADGARYLAID